MSCFHQSRLCDCVRVRKAAKLLPHVAHGDLWDADVFGLAAGVDQGFGYFCGIHHVGGGDAFGGAALA